MQSKHSRKTNKNRIVRVRNETMHRACLNCALQTALTYQECFEELCDMFHEGYVLGVNTGDELYKRIIEKLPF